MSTENNEKKYNLVFEGKLKKGIEISVVKENLHRFYNNSNSVKKLFSTDVTIIKRNISKAEASKYKNVFETTGALCSIKEASGKDEDHVLKKATKSSGENIEKKYNLVFERKQKKGIDTEIVKENLQKLYKSSNTVDKLFLKDITIIKRNISKTEAEKYKNTFETSGALCSIKEIKHIDENYVTSTNYKSVKKAAVNSESKTKHNSQEIDKPAKKSILKQKSSWLVIIFVLISILLLANFYFLNPDIITNSEETNQADSNKKKNIQGPLFILFN